MKKVIYIVLGFCSLGIGVLGVILPMLPAFPFLLFSAYCFSKSSKRIHDWFIHTKLYQKHLEGYISGKGMTWNTKIKVMVMITLLMSIGFIMMHKVLIGQIVLFIVWLFHIVYFTCKVKTRKSSVGV